MDQLTTRSSLNVRYSVGPKRGAQSNPQVPGDSASHPKGHTAQEHRKPPSHSQETTVKTEASPSPCTRADTRCGRGEYAAPHCPTGTPMKQGSTQRQPTSRNSAGSELLPRCCTPVEGLASRWPLLATLCSRAPARAHGGTAVCFSARPQSKT